MSQSIDIIDTDTTDNHNNDSNSIKINDKLDPKIEKDMQTILSMGYDEKMIRKVYIILKPSDINEALDFLSQQDGIYHHDFMETHGKQNQCFICGNPPQNHINYEPKEPNSNLLEKLRDSIGHTDITPNPKRTSNNSGNKIDLKEPLIELNNNDKIIIEENSENNDGEPIYCELCTDEIKKKKEIKNNTLPCGHLFCDDCYLNYLQDKIKNNKVGKITCMQHKCPHTFDDDFIISHLANDEILINKYKKFKLRTKLYEDSNIKFCPIKDCESYAKREGNEKYVTCLEGHQFCFECSKPWHGDKKCQEEIDKDFKKWKKNKLLKRCPKCQFWTEKNLGCNHMTCPECKYEWCWLCKGKCDKGHFKIGGGCYGLQFTHIDCWNNCLFLYGYKFLMWLFQSIIILFYIPILMFAFGKSYENELIEKYPKFLYFTTASLFAIMYIFIFLAIGAVAFVVTIPAYCLKKVAISFLLDLIGY